jgi:hypothetical protein
LQLQITVTINVVVSIGTSLSTLVDRGLEAAMVTIIELICVMAGAAALWRSGDWFHLARDGRWLRRLIWLQDAP